MVALPDGEFLKGLFRRFFSDKILTSKLQGIQELDRWGGFERWLQIEFALFLEHEVAKGRVREYLREDFARMNKNSGGKVRIHFDFNVKKAGGLKNLCVEFKALRGFVQCLSGLDSDWEDYLKAKKVDLAGHKELYFMGVCDPNVGKKTWTIKSINDHIKKEYEVKPIDVRGIKGTDLIYFIF